MKKYVLYSEYVEYECDLDIPSHPFIYPLLWPHGILKCPLSIICTLQNLGIIVDHPGTICLLCYIYYKFWHTSFIKCCFFTPTRDASTFWMQPYFLGVLVFLCFCFILINCLHKLLRHSITELVNVTLREQTELILLHLHLFIYSFSRHFYPKRLTIEEYNKRCIIKRQTDTESACYTTFIGIVPSKF